MDISINIKIGDVVVTLDERDARVLREKLNVMFAPVRPEYWWIPYPNIPYPGYTTDYTIRGDINLLYSSVASS